MPGILEVMAPYEPYLLLLLRVVVGAGFLLHGYPKLKGGWRQAGQWIKSMGVPSAVVLPVTVLELFGGIFLIVGLIVPVVGGLLALEMLGVIVMMKTKMKASFVVMEPSKPTYEKEVLYLLLAVAFVVLGAGTISLDSILGL